MKNQETRVLTAHLPGELAGRLDLLAAQLDRSRAWIVRQALENWVATEEERHRLTLEALAEVDAGRTVDHAEVTGWLAGKRRK